VYAFQCKLKTDYFSKDISFNKFAIQNDSNYQRSDVNEEIAVVSYEKNKNLFLVNVGKSETFDNWKTRYLVELHPITGAFQTIDNTAYEVQLDLDEKKSFLFQSLSNDDLLSIGTPRRVISKLRKIQSKEEFTRLKEKISTQVGEALGEYLASPNADIKSIAKKYKNKSGFSSDFTIVNDDEDLKRILTQSFHEWMLFLHPSQEDVLYFDASAPLKITGAAGTGKTIIGLHRAKRLAQLGFRVFLTSYNKQLCNDLENKISKLCSEEERGLITVSTIHSAALNYLKEKNIRAIPIHATAYKTLKSKAFKLKGKSKNVFAEEEWDEFVEKQAILTWEEYRDIDRIGRGQGLDEKERKKLWFRFQKLIDDFQKNNRWPYPYLCRLASDELESDEQHYYDSVIVDEVQDLNNPDIMFLKNLLPKNRMSITLLGDGAQRIYRGTFSLRSLGIETRGRSKSLTLNYRTTKQILDSANKLRQKNVDDLSGGEDQSDVHIVNKLIGPEPVFKGFTTFEDENRFILSHVEDLIDEGMRPSEIAIMARTGKGYYYLKQYMEKNGIKCAEYKDKSHAEEAVFFTTMHSAKGLEYRSVIITGCNKKNHPLVYDLNKCSTPKDKEAYIQRERNLLYVSMTRARESLLVTWTGEKSTLL
jgi:superfamily I DNA/RNA helicase